MIRTVGNGFSGVALAFVAAGVLAACAGVGGPESGEAGFADEPQSYLLDGVRYSPAEMAKRTGGRTLYYVATPEASAQGSVHVFDTQTEADAFKRQYRPTHTAFEPLLFESNTTLYDHTGYDADKLKLTKGTVINDLHALTQPDGESWGNDVSSLRAADGVWTDLYDFKNLDTNEWRWSTYGDNYKTLPDWVDNDASSLEIGQ